MSADAEAEREQAEPRQRVAERWSHWDRVFGQRDHAVELVALAGVEPGDQVLDVAVGAADTTLTAAHRAGPEGRVLGVDAAPGTLSMASRRATQSGLGNVELVLTDLDELDVPAPDFDAAVCGMALMLLPDPVPVVRRVRDLLRPRARFAASVWASPDRVPVLAAAFAAVGAPTGGDSSTLFALSDPRDLSNLLASAGFESVDVHVDTVRTEFDDPSEYVAFLTDEATMVREQVDRGTSEGRDEITARIEREVEALSEPDGRLVLDNDVLMVVGSKPATSS